MGWILIRFHWSKGVAESRFTDTPRTRPSADKNGQWVAPAGRFNIWARKIRTPNQDVLSHGGQNFPAVPYITDGKYSHRSAFLNHGRVFRYSFCGVDAISYQKRLKANRGAQRFRRQHSPHTQKISLALSSSLIDRIFVEELLASGSPGCTTVTITRAVSVRLASLR